MAPIVICMKRKKILFRNKRKRYLSRQTLYFLKDKRKSNSEESLWNSEWFAIVSFELVSGKIVIEG